MCPSWKMAEVGIKLLLLGPFNGAVSRSKRRSPWKPFVSDSMSGQCRRARVRLLARRKDSCGPNKQNAGIWQRTENSGGVRRTPTITALQFSPNNTKLVVGTGGNTGRLILWDVRKGQLLRTYNDPEKKSRKITAIQISPDGSLVYFGNDRGNVNQWEYQSKPGVKKS